jgi:hypothetical protein
MQATSNEAAAARDRVSKDLEAARQALREQFKEMQNLQDAAMAAQQQVGVPPPNFSHPSIKIR